jgi:hypothetical protein
MNNQCSKIGIKREGESCTLNNNCIYPNCIIDEVKLNNESVWKVEYHNTDKDWLMNIKTIKEFDNFEDAKDFTIMKIGNHMGSVRLIHPNIVN